MSHLEDASIKVLAVASGGGHWEQLMLLRPALESFDLVFATSDVQFAARHQINDCLDLPESNRSRPFRVVRCFFRASSIVRQVKPDVIITTGALPGLLTIFWGRIYGAKTIWLDSFANSQSLSMSGRVARLFANRWLTQWQHLSHPGGPAFIGALL